MDYEKLYNEAPDMCKLNRDVMQGKSGGKIIWQPRIGCWYDDRVFRGEEFPKPYTGLDKVGLYQALGCSNRLYEFSGCIRRVDDDRIEKYERQVDELHKEVVIKTPIGSINQIIQANTSNSGQMQKKWYVETKKDVEVAIWIEEKAQFYYDEAKFLELFDKLSTVGAPATFTPRTNIQALSLEWMGIEPTIYGLIDMPDHMDAFIKTLDAMALRYLDAVIESPIEFVNFGDNIHSSVLSPRYFEKYLLPQYIIKNDKLHNCGKFKFTNSHWDGDCKPLLKFAKEAGLDGIEAVTPEPQGDVTLKEVKEAFGDELFLIDGIAALLFNENWPIEKLKEQTEEVIELFAPKLILGISDEIGSNGSLDRVKYVTDMVEKYNSKF